MGRQEGPAKRLGEVHHKSRPLCRLWRRSLAGLPRLDSRAPPLKAHNACQNVDCTCTRKKQMPIDCHYADVMPL